MDHIFNDTLEMYAHADDLLVKENKSLVKYNAKQSDALRRIVKEVRDHKYQMGQTPGDWEQADHDLHSTVEEIAAEFGGLYGTV